MSAPDAMCYPLQEVIREAFPNLRFATGQIMALEDALKARFGRVIVKTSDSAAAEAQVERDALRKTVLAALVFVEEWETEIPHDHPLRRMIDALRKAVIDPPLPSSPIK